MNIFNKIFGKSKPSAAEVAKERLSIVVSHRARRKNPDFLPNLHSELVTVISKYVKIDPDQIRVQLEQEGECSVLELNIALPANADANVTSLETEEA